MTYLATFYTHAAALMSHRNLTKSGRKAVMMPVPRAVSSSCGTCVKYESPDPAASCMDTDMEAIYGVEDGTYRKLLENE